MEAVKVKGEGSRVRSGRVEGILKVHEEGIAAPIETILDERVRELGAVEEIGSGNSD